LLAWRMVRARGAWNPPWLTARPARGPPASEGLYPSTEAAWIDPRPADDGYIDDRCGQD